MVHGLQYFLAKTFKKSLWEFRKKKEAAKKWYSLFFVKLFIKSYHKLIYFIKHY